MTKYTRKSYLGANGATILFCSFCFMLSVAILLHTFTPVRATEPSVMITIDGYVYDTLGHPFQHWIYLQLEVHQYWASGEDLVQYTWAKADPTEGGYYMQDFQMYSTATNINVYVIGARDTNTQQQMWVVQEGYGTASPGHPECLMSNTYLSY